MKQLVGFLVVSVLALPLNASGDILEPNLLSPFPISSVSSDFGPRNVAVGSRFHEGVDYSQDAATPIRVYVF